MQWKLRIITVILMLFTGTASLQLHAQGDEAILQAGEALFKTNCASCHNKNMKDDLTGPALVDYAENWAEYPREDLYAWVKNSQALVQEGHPRAVELWNEWKPTVMTPMGLSDEEIDNILAYVDAVAAGDYGLPKDPNGPVVIEKKPNYTYLYLALAVVLLGLALILARMTSVMRSLARAQESGKPAEPKTFKDLLLSRSVIFFVIFTLVLFGGYTTVNNAIELGRQEGYQPEQPIKFSHETHAGINEIDCQFCHDGARRSKHSIIPSATTCMKCHKAIKTGSTYGTAEITKIYASLGFNPLDDSYIENYMDMEQDSVAAVYKEWIAAEYLKDSGEDELSARGEEVVKREWNAIVSSLTNEQKTKVQGPIEWTRIHNLPDHVYFNHSQHVTVGKVECEQCHGEVSGMEVLEQAKPLSMGWCVNCHRQSEVKGFSEGNEYYMHTYEEYVKALEAGEMEEVKVEDIGGLECQKCHY